ncbi:MAG: hypothetical protein Q7V57_03475 [Actinomycetota bacterium]|nr:hypothetical protein [Actinomycetota bacterium]
MSAPRLGGFDGAVVGGAHDHDPSALLSGAPVLGLRRESTYLFASLRDADGRMYSAMRRQSDPAGWPNRLLTRSSLATGAIDRHDLPVRTAASAAISSTLRADEAVFSAPSSEGSEPFECTVTNTALRWSEGAALHLAGHDVSQGLQWYLPDAAGSMLYVSRLFHVEGTFHGTPVEGIAGVDQVFLEPGRANYVDDPLTARHLSLAWTTWANVYDDGTSESGHAAFGPGRFGFAVRSTNAGDVHVAQHVSGSLSLVGGSPDHATFEIDGAEWEYIVDDLGHCPPLGGPVLQSEGCLRRVGDTRTPLAWSASLEVPA